MTTFPICSRAQQGASTLRAAAAQAQAAHHRVDGQRRAGALRPPQAQPPVQRTMHAAAPSHVQHSLLARLASLQHVHSAGAATRSAPANPHPRTKSTCPSFGPPSRVLQTIPYSKLMGALEVGNIRALEDILITDCFYTGLLRGKLDQERRWAEFGWQGMGVREHACLALAYEFCEFCRFLFTCLGAVVLSWCKAWGTGKAPSWARTSRAGGGQRGGLWAGFGCMSAAKPRFGGLQPAGPLCHLLGPTHAAQTQLALQM